MPTVIDALAVTLSLDPGAYRKGAAEAQAAQRKLREAAVKDGQGVEKAMSSAGESVERLARNFLKLFALFTAGRAVKDFIGDITAADAAMGRLAKSIGSTPEVISSLANAVARNGGNANAAAGSFERLADTINEIKVTGNSSAMPALARLQGATGKQIRLNTDLATTFGDMADAAKAMADKGGISLATYLLKQAGVDADTAALLVQGRDKLNEALAKSQRVGIVSEKDAKAAQELQTSIETLRQTSESFGRTILTSVTPTIVDLLKYFQELIEKNKDWIQTNIIEGVKQFATWLKSIPWSDVLDGVRDFVVQINAGAQALGGWVNVAKIFLGLWIGSKFLAVLANIGLLRAALLGGRGGGLFGGVLSGLGVAGTLGIGAAIGGAVGADAAVPNAEKPGVMTRSDDENTGAATGSGDALGRLYRWGKRKLGFGGKEEPSDGIHKRAARAKRGPDGIPYEAKSLNEGLGITSKQYDAYREGLTDIEGKNYAQKGGAGGKYSGRYQFGPAEIRETATKLGEKPPTREQFLSDPAMQERYMERYTLDHHNYLMRKSPKYRELSPEKKLEILGYAHNQGAGGAEKYLRTGQAGSDGFGTSGTAYFNPIRRRLAQIGGSADKKSADAPTAATTRKPEVLADPNDERRRAPTTEQARQTMDEARTKVREKNAQEGGANAPSAPPVGQPPKPEAAATGRQAGAMAAIAQVQAAQSAQISRTSNDNRSTSTVSNDTRFNGPITIQTAATDADGIFQDLGDRARKSSFANASNYGQA